MKAAAILVVLLAAGLVAVQIWQPGEAVAAPRTAAPAVTLVERIVEQAESYIARDQHDLAEGLVQMTLLRDDLTPELAVRLEELMQNLRSVSPPAVSGLAFVHVPDGVYVVGTPEGERGADPRVEIRPRKVRFSEYFICTTEVTQEAYLSVCPDRAGSWPKPAGDRMPAHTVTYAEAETFCERLTERRGEFRFSLPSELEWEIACRAGRDPQTGPFAVDDKYAERMQDDRVVRALLKYANFDKNGNLIEVASRLPNPWGLYDMHGNVAEWCRQDDYLDTDEAYVHQLGKVPIRGGSFMSYWTRCRAGARGLELKTRAKGGIGFRIIARRK